MAADVQHTFIFADLAGFTALTEAMGDEDAADLAADFCELVRGIAPTYRAAAIKTIGDALMLRADDPGQAILLALEIVNDIGGQHRWPTVRAGMHTGPATERDGDWFGTTVNIAARVSGVAAGDEVLLTRATHDAAGEVEGVDLRRHGRRTLKNVTKPVLLYTAFRAGEHSTEGLPIDLVCRMAVDPARAAGTLVHKGTEYTFCSLECAQKFAGAPERYVSWVRSRRSPS